MASWDKTEIVLDNGMKAEAQAPVIVSASRISTIASLTRTDRLE